jgi:hypothetical protein
MKTFYDMEDYTINDIESLIVNEVEESIYLEFKEAAALDKNDKKKVDISKDIASFANSDGGIIIYGIKEENHKASSLSFVDGNIYTKEWLEQVINSSIQRRIPSIMIYPLRLDGNLDKTIYVVKIPKSTETPHLSKDKRFYKRFNFESVCMEEYEIRQLYGRKIKSKLGIQSWGARNIKSNSKEELDFIFEVSVVNEGDIVESDYKVNVYFNNFSQDFNFSWGTHQTNNDYTILEKRIKLSAIGQSPIFPSETVNAMRFNFQIPKSRAKELLSNAQIEILLFYSNGEDKVNGDFKQLALTLDKKEE